MPTSSTPAPAFCALLTIWRRLDSVVCSGRPRRASLAPSSTTTMAGLCRDKRSGKRVLPPMVVSPLMLALTTL
ncbi:hypothetical protein D9M71_709490 [compost metagenome]